MQRDKCSITNLFSEIEKYAKEMNVPIMMKDAIDYICSYIKENNIKSVLEIGTAIGYSAIKMCNSGARIVSIERDLERYKIAKENVEIANLDKEIELIYSDAFLVNEKRKFDMILIDAAKGKNKNFIERFKGNLNENGIIIIDNIDFHGLVGKSDTIRSRNLRSLVRKIENFLEYLDNQNEFEVEKVDVGDGLIILK